MRSWSGGWTVSSSCRRPGPVDYLQPDLAHGLVVVALDRPLDGLDVDTVTVDNEAGAQGGGRHGSWRQGTAASRLLALDIRLWTVARRVDGYRAALADGRRAPVDEALISTDPRSRARRGPRCGGCSRASDPPTAVLATNHMAGRAAMRAMRDAGTILDLAVFDSMDDNDLLATPPLVVVASGPDRIGQLAAELTVERLGGLQAPPRHAILAAADARSRRATSRSPSGAERPIATGHRPFIHPPRRQSHDQ